MRTTTDCSTTDPTIDEIEMHPETGSDRAWGSGAAHQWRSEWFRGSGRARREIRLQEILETGHTEGDTAFRLMAARRAILVAGTERFGMPDPSSVRCLYAVEDPDALDRLLPGLNEAKGWTELLELLED